MVNYNQKFEELKNSLESDVVKIHLVTTVEIAKIDINFNEGGMVPKVVNSNFTGFNIYVNLNLSDDDKIRILFHEYGHCRYMLELGYQKVIEKININKDDWEKDNELEAFKNELNSSKKLSNEVGLDFLKITIEKMETRVSKELNQNYTDALEQLQQDPLWQECINLIKK